MVNEHLPSYQEENADSLDGPSGHENLANGYLKGQESNIPLFPQVDSLLSLFKDSCTELIDLRRQVLLAVNYFF